MPLTHTKQLNQSICRMTEAIQCVDGGAANSITVGQMIIEFAASGQTTHAEIFRQRVLTPILDGGTPPAMAELAQEFGLAEKQACNCLVTARRAFQRLLREEIAVYATSDEEIATEIKDLFRFAAQG